MTAGGDAGEAKGQKQMKCDQKKRFLTQASAARKAAALARRYPKQPKLYEYKCPDCGLFHLTTWAPGKFNPAYKPAAPAAAKPAAPVKSLKHYLRRLTEINVAMALSKRREEAAERKRAEAAAKVEAQQAAMRQDWANTLAAIDDMYNRALVKK